MKVKFFATYRKITGTGAIEVSAPENVLALLHLLTQRYPAFEGVLLNEDGTDKNSETIVMVCGRHIEHLDGVRTPLHEEDYVAVTPLVAGG